MGHADPQAIRPWGTPMTRSSLTRSLLRTSRRTPARARRSRLTLALAGVLAPLALAAPLLAGTPAQGTDPGVGSATTLAARGASELGASTPDADRTDRAARPSDWNWDHDHDHDGGGQGSSNNPDSLIVPRLARWKWADSYATYDPQTTCFSSARPGTAYAARWIVAHYGGGSSGILRACSQGGTSEHKEGRAFDWANDAATAAGRARASRFLEALFATDDWGRKDSLARRMGVMYVIWNDRIYNASSGFEAKPYLHSSCTSLKKCGKTLRHRDHVHISFSRRGAYGLTTWYAGRL